MTRAASSLLLFLSLLACAPDQEGSSGTDQPGPDAGALADAGTPDAGPPADATAQRLFQLLHGRFDSSEQASANAAYLAVQLETCVVDAPEFGTRVLYVEQAVMGSLGQPYRQRLYVVEQGEAANTARSRVFEFVRPADWVGSCALDALALLPEDVEERVGCDVVLTWDGSSFSGGTSGQDCASTLQGASYATSQVTLQQDQLLSWDRGFDAQGRQVWGAAQGPYVFVRRTPISD
jgi:CpeT protein